MCTFYVLWDSVPPKSMPISSLTVFWPMSTLSPTHLLPPKGLGTITQLVKVRGRKFGFDTSQRPIFMELSPNHLRHKIWANNFFWTRNMTFMASKMAKNSHLLMELWPIFDIFDILRPQLWSKQGLLGLTGSPHIYLDTWCIADICHNHTTGGGVLFSSWCTS